MRGEALSVVDIDGIGSGTSDVWDPALSIAEIYRRSIDRQRIMFLVGAKNRERGFEPLACAVALKSLAGQCQLTRRQRDSSSELGLRWRMERAEFRNRS